MLYIGCINNLGLGLILAYLNQLSSEYDRNMQCAQFLVAVQAVPILVRMYVANNLINTPHDLRLFYVTLI